MTVFSFLNSQNYNSSYVGVVGSSFEPLKLSAQVSIKVTEGSRVITFLRDDAETCVSSVRAPEKYPNGSADNVMLIYLFYRMQSS